MIPQAALIAFGSNSAPAPGAAVAKLTTFTYSGQGAAESQINDGNDSTPCADPTGLQTTTSAAFDYGQAVLPTNVRVKVSDTFGFSASATFRVQYNDTGLSGTWSNGPTFVIPGGTGGIVNQTITGFGAHRYWRIVYDSGGSIGSNAWLGEVTFS